MTLDQISALYGETYFTVEVFPTDSREPIDTALQFGTLDSIVSMMDCTLYDIDPDATGSEYAARISYEGKPVIFMPDLTSPDSAAIVPRPEYPRDPITYEIRQLDCYVYDDSWTVNTSYRLGEFTTRAKDTARAFYRALHRLGITFYKGKTRTEYDGDVYEITDRATGKPLFAAIPQEV